MKFLIRVFLSWLPLAVLTTGICGLVYTTVQQNYPQTLNDPQIQMAQDAVTYLSKNYTPAAVVPRGQSVDLATSLAPWIAVYDESGRPLESSGVLDGKPPQPPLGVFEDLKKRTATGAGIKTPFKTADIVQTGENRLSWQPTPDVRQAIIVAQIPGGKGYVVAGRNMREVEDREGQLSEMIFLAWVVLLCATFVTKAFALLVKSKIVQGKR